MKSNTSLVAQQTRLSEWADLIRCRNHLTLEITEQASASFLKTLLGVISNAQ